MTSNKHSVKSEERAWALMHRLFSSMEKCEEITIKKSGLAVHEYQVLRAIKYFNDNVTPTKITNLLDKTPYSVTLLIDRMEKRGLVERKRDLDDRRSLRIVITPAGEKKYKAALIPASEVRDQLLSVLTPDELTQLINITGKISEKSFEYRNVEDKLVDFP